MKQVGRYEVVERLGEGSMAEVYKAYDPKIDRSLALKVLREEWCTNKEYVRRFLREARAAGNFSHRNIVTVYDVGQLEDRPYIVIELLTGMSLAEVMDSGEPLPLDQILSLGMQLADALSYAHKHGVIHRDVKPSNIMLLSDGSTIKITDFGIARIDDPSAEDQTVVGTVLGTPQYMSPEQVKGKPVDERSDLFSVGVVLYQLCTGQKPFEGDSIATLLYKITEENPPQVSSLRPDVPPGVRHIINKLLAKAPEERFQSGEELHQALKHEAQILSEGASDPERRRYVPIKVKWTVLMAGFVAAIMAVSIFFIDAKQSETLERYAMDAGSSMARFIASETAVPLLSEDWVAIEIFVKDAAQGQSFDYLTILDHEGIVRGSSDDSLIGASFELPQEAELQDEHNGIRTSVVGQAGRAAILDFEAPVLFQQRRVGTVHLGVTQSAMRDVIDTTRLLLIALGMATVMAVAIVSYVLGRLLSRPLRLLRTSIAQVAEGNFNCRIPGERRDDLGEVISAFNKMAVALDGRSRKQGSEDA